MKHIYAAQETVLVRIAWVPAESSWRLTDVRGAVYRTAARPLVLRARAAIAAGVPVRIGYLQGWMFKDVTSLRIVEHTPVTGKVIA